MAKLKLGGDQVSPISNGIFEATKKSVGFVPNMYQKMGNNPALLDAYTYAYNSFRSISGFGPVEQEVVFLSVAYENDCEYCMAAHSFMGDKVTKVPAEVTDAIRGGKQIPDPKLAALSKLTRSLTANRGHATQKEIDDFLEAGYTEAQVLGIIVGIGIKTMSNYSNHLTGPDIDAAFIGRKWAKNTNAAPVYLTISTIPNPKNMGAFQTYLSKIMPIIAAFGGEKIERYQTIEQVMGNSGTKMMGIFEFPDAQAIKGMMSSEGFNELGPLRAEAFEQLDLLISQPF